MLSRFLADFRYFLVNYKLWWITPIVVILALLALLAFFSEDTGVVPGIYR